MKNNLQPKKILILAGGTGGHIFPALAVADTLKELGYEIHWLGTAMGLERQFVEGRYPLSYISAERIRGKGIKTKLVSGLRSLMAVFQALKIIRRLNPHLVLGMGGFASGPGGFAAWLLKKPLVIHEQNAVAGATNKILARFAKYVLTGFPHAFPRLKLRNLKEVGNPVRKEIWAIDHPEKRLASRVKPLRILVLGGSQGAQTINKLMIKTLELFPNISLLDIWHQTGESHYEWTYEQYQKLGCTVKVNKFINDPAKAYEWCDIAVARAGALTVSELAAAGVASILIPFPYAASDHQYFNATYLKNAGAAILIRESEITPDRLQNAFTDLMNDRKKLLLMSEQAKKIAKPQATQEVVKICMELSAN